MAGLSQNVLNMKFMKGADKASEANQPVVVKKVKDSSEWFLPNRGQVQSKLKTAVRVKTVGYGSIASLTAGEEKKKDEDSKPFAEKQKKDPKKEADEFLNDIMGKPKKNKKRKQDGNEEKSSKKSKKSKK